MSQATFTVTGRGAFPIDMLRYDRATPRTESDSSVIASTFQRRGGTRHVVRLIGRGATIERWRSFGWEVEKIERT